jgi:hypothetical protein
VNPNVPVVSEYTCCKKSGRHGGHQCHGPQDMSWFCNSESNDQTSLNTCHNSCDRTYNCQWADYWPFLYKESVSVLSTVGQTIRSHNKSTVSKWSGSSKLIIAVGYVELHWTLPRYCTRPMVLQPTPIASSLMVGDQ